MVGEAGEAQPLSMSFESTFDVQDSAPPLTQSWCFASRFRCGDSASTAFLPIADHCTLKLPVLYMGPFRCSQILLLIHDLLHSPSEPGWSSLNNEQQHVMQRLIIKRQLDGRERSELTTKFRLKTAFLAK